jgi:tetratricopeptide (TPR) repeat protein
MLSKKPHTIFIFFLALIFYSVPSHSQTSDDPYCTLFDKAMSLYKEKSMDSALYFFNEAIAASPSSAEAYFRRALVKEKLNDLDGANKDYDQAIAIDPQPVYYSNRGLNKSIKGNHQDAIGDFNKALELDPDYMQAYMNRGTAYHYMGDSVNACQDVGKAYELGFKLARQFLEEYCR